MHKVSLSSKRQRVTAYVDAEIEVSIGDVENDDLIAELEMRGALPSALPKTLEAFPQGTMLEILEFLERGEHEEARLLVHALVYPKWKTPEDCEAVYKRIKASA